MELGKPRKSFAHAVGPCAGKPPARFDEGSETTTDREASSFPPHSALAYSTSRLQPSVLTDAMKLTYRNSCLLSSIRMFLLQRCVRGMALQTPCFNVWRSVSFDLLYQPHYALSMMMSSIAPERFPDIRRNKSPTLSTRFFQLRGRHTSISVGAPSSVTPMMI